MRDEAQIVLGGLTESDTRVEAHGLSWNPSPVRTLARSSEFSNFFHHYAALEVWNGMNINHQNEFLLDRIGIWMNLLNQGC